MKRNATDKGTPVGGARWFVLVVLPICGLAGLFLTARQVYPHLAAAYWQRQLADVPAARAEIALSQLAELDDAGVVALVEALGSEREAVALGAKRHLLDGLEKWRSLPETEQSQRTLMLVESLAEYGAAFGPTARRDACELATQVLLLPPIGKSPADRSRTVAACDEVFQFALTLPGESLGVAPVQAKPKSKTGDRAPQSIVLQPLDRQHGVASQFDPLPGGGLPLREAPAEKPKIEYKLPGEDRELPPGYFQEPAGTRSLDFSNQNAKPLRVSQIPNSPTDGVATRPVEPPILATSNNTLPPGETPPSDLQNCATLDLMRQLADPNDGRARDLQAELRRRGLSAAEIGLARRLFDANPAVRKQLVAELPATPDIDASDWLLQCAKDEDAEVRLAAFSLLATSPNALLRQKVKIAAASDADTRVRQIAEKIRDERVK
jgi:hypothetical protein